MKAGRTYVAKFFCVVLFGENEVGGREVHVAGMFPDTPDMGAAGRRPAVQQTRQCLRRGANPSRLRGFGFAVAGPLQSMQRLTPSGQLIACVG